MLLPLVWIGAVLFTFSVPSLKWPHYGLGCTPAAILLACRVAPPRWARLATATLLSAAAAAVALILRWPLPALGTLALAVAAALLAGGAAWMVRDRLVPAAAATGAALGLVSGVAVPALNPPVIPGAALRALEGRRLFVYDHAPGIFTLAAGRAVRRAPFESDIGPTLASGGVLILAEPALTAVPSAYRARLGEVARWNRIPPALPPERVWRAWRDRDLEPLFEPVLAVELRDRATAAARCAPTRP